jgi:hypothetical protein
MADNKGGIKTGNFLTDWMIDRVNSGMTRNPETGKMEAGFLSGALGGAVGLDVDLIGRTKEANISNTAANDLIAGSTYTREDLGYKPGQKLTESQVKSGVKALEKKKADAETEKIDLKLAGIRSEGYTESAKTLAAQLQAQNANNTATLAQQSAQHNATLTSQQNQFAHTSEQNALTRRHDMERGDKRDSLNLQMQVMQNDLAEKRMDYDRETRRMDKRTAAIAQLMSGLGSLGGAFAL